MPEPSSALLLSAEKRNPVPTAHAKPFPNVRIPVYASGLLWSIERNPRRGADTVGEAFVVPERRVLEHEPAPGLTDAAPAFALVAVAAHPARGVEVAFEAEFLLTGE